MKTVSLFVGTAFPNHVPGAVQSPLAWEYFFAANAELETKTRNKTKRIALQEKKRNG